MDPMGGRRPQPRTWALIGKHMFLSHFQIALTVVAGIRFRLGLCVQMGSGRWVYMFQIGGRLPNHDLALRKPGWGILPCNLPCKVLGERL